MISFRVNDQYLDYDGSSMGMIYRTSILNLNSSYGNRSFSISFPFTSKNDLVFKFQRFEDVGKGSKAFECEMLFNGASLHSGRLVLFETNSSYDCYFYPNKATLKGLSALLNELTDLDESVDLGETSEDVASAAQSHNPEAGYAWPAILNYEFYDEMPGWSGGINPKTLTTAAALVNATGAGGAENKFSFVPCLYLIDVVLACAARMGYRPTGDLLEDERFKNIVIYNNRPLDERGGQNYKSSIKFQDRSHQYIPSQLEVSSISEGASYIYTGDFDTYDWSNGLANFPTAVTIQYSYYTAQAAGVHRITPRDVDMKANRVMQQLASTDYFVTIALILYRDDGDEVYQAHVWETTGPVSDIQRHPDKYYGVWEPHELELESGDEIYFGIDAREVDPLDGELDRYPDIKGFWVDIENLSSAELNVWAKSFNKLDTLPDADIKTLFQSLKQWCACLIQPNDTNKSLEFSKLKNILLQGDVEDWSEKQAGDPVIDFSQSKHHEWKCSDEDLEGDFYRVKADQNDVDTVRVSPAFQTLRTLYSYTDGAAQERWMFVGFDRAISPEYGQRDTNRELRFLELDKDGDFESSRRTFRGIMDYFWRDVAGVLVNAEPVSMPLRLTINDVQNLDFKKKKLINGTEYLLTELRVPYETNKIGVCMAEMIKLNTYE